MTPAGCRKFEVLEVRERNEGCHSKYSGAYRKRVRVDHVGPSLATSSIYLLLRLSAKPPSPAIPPASESIEDGSGIGKKASLYAQRSPSRSH